MRLSARLVPIGEVSAAQRDAMFALMDRHYANVRREAFEADFAAKQWVIEVTDPATGQLCGFSTQQLQEATVAGRSIKVLFSGDTIIDREHWGDPALSHAWGRHALSLIDAYPGEELYWFLISKGYKTYRFLPLFFHEFYPRHDASTPSAIWEILNTLARARYPDEYVPTAGIIRATAKQYRLRPGLADITAGRLADPHVSFFRERNPGHLRGDELCCLAPLTRANFTPAALRVIGPEPPPLESP